MSKAIFIFLLILLIVGLFSLVSRNRVSNFKPSQTTQAPNESLPTTSNGASQKGRVGEPVNFPLHIQEGFQIGVFAKDLGSPRDLEFSPAGTLILSIPSLGKVVALPDKDQDGKADQVKTLLFGLDGPHGLAFFQGKLLVAEEARVVRYSFDEESLTATKEKELLNLPVGGRHTTRTIAFDSSGKMFVSIGSTCDVCFEKNSFLAAVITSDAEGNNPRVFAKGLRNAVFITVNPKTGELWGTEMGRDFLGDNAPPDEINIIRDGKDYGWPICYGDRVYDQNFGKESPNYCQNTETPIYQIAAHTAPLGLTFIPSASEEQGSLINSAQFPQSWQGDLLVSYHGSWNRSTPIGYKVVHLGVAGNQIKGEEDFISGFLQGSQALGRPVDLIFDKEGSLYISDDKAGVIYKVVKN